MTQLSAVFPEDISRGFIGGPNFKTTVTETGGGFRYPNIDWDVPLGRWTAGHDARTEENFGRVRAHFYVARGMGNTFPFKDWGDFKCPDFSGVGVIVDGQFYKRYTSGADYFDRLIVLPKEATIVGGHFDTNGNFVASGGLETDSNGDLIGGTATAWEGEFYCLCSYGTDAMKAEVIDGPEDARLIGWSGIEIEEARST